LLDAPVRLKLHFHKILLFQRIDEVEVHLKDFRYPFLFLKNVQFHQLVQQISYLHIRAVGIFNRIACKIVAAQVGLILFGIKILQRQLKILSRWYGMYTIWIYAE
jgi:hypothetical protein